MSKEHLNLIAAHNTYGKRKTLKMEYIRTPDEIWEMLSQEFNFTVDACASDKRHLVDKYWTKEDSEYMLGKDILEAEHLARSVYNSKTGNKFSDLDENRKMMLTEMAFNMGTKLEGFPKFMKIQITRSQRPE